MDKKKQFEHPELEEFKQNANKRSPYFRWKKQFIIYKLIFISLGILFIVLTFQIYYRSLGWLCEQILVNCQTLKSILMAFSFAFAILALWIGIHIDPAHEVAHHLNKEVRHRLNRAYTRKKRLLQKRKLASATEKEKQLNNIESLYEESLDKVNRREQEAFVIIDRVASTRLVKLERETLYNQYLIELEHDYEIMFKDFQENSTLPLLS
ncbi:MAG: hypothetical protein WD595_04165 [Waddliaceae bacterium]